MPTHIQRLQAVPAEGVLAVLTHHLGAALVSLNVHLALGTALDGGVVPLLALVDGAAGGGDSEVGAGLRVELLRPGFSNPGPRGPPFQMNGVAFKLCGSQVMTVHWNQVCGSSESHVCVQVSKVRWERLCVQRVQARPRCVVPGLPWQEAADGHGLLAGLAPVPDGPARPAELQAAGGALDQLGQR